MAKKKRVNTGTQVGQLASNGVGGKLALNAGGTASVESFRISEPDVTDRTRKAVAAPTVLVPAEVERGDWTIAIMAFMIFLTPAIGMPNEEMLQDTLKSMVVGFAAVIAGLLFFWHQRNRRDALRWHAVMWLPLALMVYALGSMVWSHSYLGGVEAVRWFLFSLILFLSINTFSRSRLQFVIEGIHWGAVVCSLWAALQFWVDFSFFPQGPNPASTFVNRNFFAEFVVCTIPFSAYLLAQATGSGRIALMSLSSGLVIVALMITGTRGALAAMWLLLAVVLPLAGVLYRQQLALHAWGSAKRILAAGLLVATVVGLGLISTGNPKLEADASALGSNAFDRAFKRTASISRSDYSLGVRFVMWRATGRMIEAHPLRGVGAGAWEVVLPLYQAEGAQLETDYYVHNEVLQLLAEYGLTGLMFLLSLFSYLLYSAWTTVRNRTAEGLAEAPVRIVALASLLSLLIVSNIGFPWRLASTGCIFALSLGLLAASDSRLQKRGWLLAMRLPWKPVYSQLLAVFMVVCLALTAYISQQAGATESKIVKSVKLALGISQSGDFNNPKWDNTKKELLVQLREGIAINPHYRKVTPMVADEMAKWGDWKNAVFVWESVISSRPHIVAIMSNIARGYAQMGNYEKALEYLARCEKLQPKAITVRSLKIILYSRTGKDAEAKQMAKQSMQEGTYDVDLINAGYVLGVRAGDFDMAITALELRQKIAPNLNADTFIKLGNIYATSRKDPVKALAAYRSAIAATAPAPEAEKSAIRSQVPQPYLGQL
jgi:O-antigen ligase